MLVTYLIWIATALLFLIGLGLILLAVLFFILILDGIKRINKRAM